MTLSPNSVFMLVSIFCVAIFVLVTLLWLFGPAPKNAEYNKADESKTMSIEEIMKILDNPKTPLVRLTEAVDNFFQYYDNLELSDYRKKSFFFAVIVHPHTSTDLIIETEKHLKELNPDLASELSKTLNRGLNARDLK